MPADWRLHTEARDGKNYFRFTARTALDESSSDFFQDVLNRKVDELKPQDLWIDFGNVNFIASVALGTLLALRKKILSRGATLTIFNLQPPVYDIFKVTHLLKLFNVPDNEAQTELRTLAYLKWEAAGKPEGDSIRFWLEAERELLQTH